MCRRLVTLVVVLLLSTETRGSWKRVLVPERRGEAQYRLGPQQLRASGTVPSGGIVCFVAGGHPSCFPSALPPNRVSSQHEKVYTPEEVSQHTSPSLRTFTQALLRPLRDRARPVSVFCPYHFLPVVVSGLSGIFAQAVFHAKIWGKAVLKEPLEGFVGLIARHMLAEPPTEKQRWSTGPGLSRPLG
ncbi:hypothetical protein BDW71DRAFT_181637 [Aspergillus fruticulosus]